MKFSRDICACLAFSSIPLPRAIWARAVHYSFVAAIHPLLFWLTFCSRTPAMHFGSTFDSTSLLVIGIAVERICARVSNRAQRLVETDLYVFSFMFQLSGILKSTEMNFALNVFYIVFITQGPHFICLVTVAEIFLVKQRKICWQCKNVNCPCHLMLGSRIPIQKGPHIAAMSH